MLLNNIILICIMSVPEMRGRNHNNCNKEETKNMKKITGKALCTLIVLSVLLFNESSGFVLLHIISYFSFIVVNFFHRDCEPVRTLVQLRKVISNSE